MRETKTFDYFLLTLLALIWASAFFNIKIATYSYGPLTIAFLRIFFGAIPVVLLCYFKKIKIEAFSKDWYWFAAIGIINLVIPFFLIAYGVQNVQSNLAAILMASTPLTAAAMAHFFTKNEKINIFKVIGVLIGFSGVLFLFLDKIIINESNYIFALITILGSTFYSIGGILTIKIKNRGNENVTTSTTIWSLIFLFPMAIILEKPWLANPTFESTLSLLYLGIVATGLAWLIRFRILAVNGLVFQTQVAYLIPIFGVFFGYFLMNEVITWRVLISLSIIIFGIYIVKKNNKGLS